MRPMPFSIEIPDRPAYQPGSGPAMAPITLQPDDCDTGWVIADTVDFQGLSQYVVTPVDNPAHRRPVKRQHILDWVSPKAHEDFEFAQYKIHRDAELAQDIEILAKVAAIKERRHGMGLARERAKARKPFAKYMQLEHIDDSDRGNTSGHLSSPEHSPEESNGRILLGRVVPAKRKHLIGFPAQTESSVKRRGYSGSGTPSLVWKAWKAPLLQPRQRTQFETIEYETDAEDEDETTSKFNFANSERISTSNQPSPPPEAPGPTPRQASILQKPSVSPYFAPSLFIPESVSPSRVLAKLQRSALNPPLPTSLDSIKSAPAHSETPSSWKISPLDSAKNISAHSPVQLYTKIWGSPASRPISASPHVTSNGVAESSRNGNLRLRRQSLSPADERTSIEGESGGPRKSDRQRSEPVYWKEVIERSRFSDVAFSRGMEASAEHLSQGQRKGKASRSSSSGSSNVLRWPTTPKSPMMSNKQSAYFASMKMTQKAKKVVEAREGVQDDSDGESEETWDIHGILDDEMRRLNSGLVRYYLCEWVGDYDPTWEPEGNVSKDAIKRYEKKKRRNSLGFDGGADIDLISEIAEVSDRKTLRTNGSILVRKDEASSSTAYTGELVATPRFLTANKGPRSRSGAISDRREEMVVDGELL